MEDWHMEREAGEDIGKRSGIRSANSSSASNDQERARRLSQVHTLQYWISNVQCWISREVSRGVQKRWYKGLNSRFSTYREGVILSYKKKNYFSFLTQPLTAALINLALKTKNILLQSIIRR